MTDVWRLTEEIRLRAIVICRGRDSGSPVCAEVCRLCLSEAIDERLTEIKQELNADEDEKATQERHRRLEALREEMDAIATIIRRTKH